MDGKAALNLLKDRRILVIIIAVIIIVAAVAVVVLTGDDDKGSQDPSDGLTISSEQTFSEDRLVEGTLTVAADGKLTLADGVELRMLGPDARIIVQGTLDASKGKVSFVTENEDGTYTEVYSNGANESRSITVSGNGEMIVEGNNFENTGYFDDSTGIKAFVNAATYDADPNVHITTLSKAMAVDSDVTIRGTLTDSTAVTADKDSIIIDTGARATLGSITLTNGGSVEALGTVSAKVTSSGSTLDLSGVSGLTVTSSGNFAIDGKMTGSMTVSAGTVYVDNVDATAGTVTVAQNATLALEKTTSLDGILAVGEDENDLRLSGIITVGVKPAKLPAEGTMNVGIDGLITYDATGFLKLYPGVQGFTVGDAIKSTVFEIDGTPYMTVYGNSTIAAVLASENVNSAIVSDATAFRNVANWNDAENMAGDAVAADTTLGAEGFTTVYYATVKVTLTVEIPNVTGLRLMIDGNDVEGTSVTLAAGSHTFAISSVGGSYVLDLDGTKSTGPTGSITISETSKKITVMDASTGGTGGTGGSETGESGGDTGSTGGAGGSGNTGGDETGEGEGSGTQTPPTTNPTDPEDNS